MAYSLFLLKKYFRKKIIVSIIPFEYHTYGGRTFHYVN